MKNTFLLSATFLALSASSLLASPQQATPLNHHAYSSVENIFSIYNGISGDKTCKSLSIPQTTSDTSTVSILPQENCITKTFLAYFINAYKPGSGSIIQTDFCQNDSRIEGANSFKSTLIKPDGAYSNRTAYSEFEKQTNEATLEDLATYDLLVTLNTMGFHDFSKDSLLAEINTKDCTIKHVNYTDLTNQLSRNRLNTTSNP